MGYVLKSTYSSYINTCHNDCFELLDMPKKIAADCKGKNLAGEGGCNTRIYKYNSIKPKATTIMNAKYNSVT